MPLAALLVATALAGARAAPAHAPAGALLHLEMRAPSLGGAVRRVQVYLPPGYAAPDSSSRAFPVIYLLHGWPGSEGNWFGGGHAARIADSLFAGDSIPEVILVSANGAGRGFLGRSLYLDGRDSSMRVARFIARDLVEWTDTRFRTLRDPRHRGLIGLSDGATAALCLAFRHPDVFGACGGHSGEYRLARGWTVRGVLGPEPFATRRLEENSPLLIADTAAARLSGLSIYFDVGTSDGALASSRALHRTLDSLGVAHTYREFRGGHNWSYWRAHLRESLIAVTAQMR